MKTPEIVPMLVMVIGYAYLDAKMCIRDRFRHGSSPSLWLLIPVRLGIAVFAALITCPFDPWTIVIAVAMMASFFGPVRRLFEILTLEHKDDWEVRGYARAMTIIWNPAIRAVALSSIEILAFGAFFNQLQSP
jgi:hypothetical protein